MTSKQGLIEDYKNKILAIRNYKSEEKEFHVNDLINIKKLQEIMQEVFTGESDLTPAGKVFLENYYDKDSLVEILVEAINIIVPVNKTKAEVISDWFEGMIPMEISRFIEESKGNIKPGQQLREDLMPNKKHKHSSVILVFNDKGELALQLRAKHDDSYPGHWDFSAAGGIKDKEKPEEAAERELKEEIGIILGDEVSTPRMQFICEEMYEDELCTDQCYFYMVKNNGPFNIDPKEVDDVVFFSLDEIKKMMEIGAKFHPEFPYFWKRGIIKKAIGIKL